MVVGWLMGHPAPSDDIGFMVAITMIPTKKQIEVHGNIRWQLDHGIDPATGTRKRVSFETEKEADDEIAKITEDIKKRGGWWARLTEVKRAMIAAVVQDIESAGQKLDEVWADWKRWKRDNQQSVTRPKAYEDVVKEWARVKIAASADEKYIHDSIGTVLAKFGSGPERQNIHEISAAELEKWIESRCKLKGSKEKERTWGLTSRRTNTSLFSGVWRWPCRRSGPHRTSPRSWRR